ncbi:hypothetical protein [Paenibacillus sp.]|jgi:biotin carboxylase|uniref:ATP-grasp domain-containing protein n=1 Tax=Paenibacillus sp. TaxID=58172 RepID=UPI002827C68E|nr:hypothetical protein [Paenibacillus sp.]MDR0270822.1 hypothetical protein [Paenibacillus sp.]
MDGVYYMTLCDNKKIIVVEPGSSMMYISEAIKMLGYQPIVLASIKEYSGDQKSYLEKSGYYEVDAKSVDNIINCIEENQLTNIHGILSTADRYIIPACLAAERLGIKGMDPALLKLNNKIDVFNLIQEFSPSSIIINYKNIPWDELDEMLQKYGAIVVKPSKSAGGKGIIEIKSTDGLSTLNSFLINEKKVDLLNQDLIVQPKLEGTLYSVEGYVKDGVPIYIGLSKRTRIGCTESRNEFPTETYNPELFSKMKSIVEALIKRSSYCNGYFHAEFLADEHYTVLIDANFGRVGGGGIALQIAHSYGVPIEKLYSHVVDITLLENKIYNGSIYCGSRRDTMFIQYSTESSGVFENLETSEPLKSYHVQMAEKGKRLQPVGQNNNSLVGILVGDVKDVLLDITHITVHTDQGIFTPVY